MALNQNEKELLAVVRYYNENKRDVAKLVTKLMKDFDLPDVKALTGLNRDEILKLQEMVHRKPSPSRATKKVQADIREASEELESNKNRRLAIHINAESDLPQRVAHGMAAFIAKELNPGDAWLSRKEAMAKFECKSGTLTTANGILVKHNWIEFAEPGSFRKGYVVK